MSRQRVTGMRIPHTPRPRRTRSGWWLHGSICAATIFAIVLFIAAGEPFLAVPFILIGVAYMAAEVHS